MKLISIIAVAVIAPCVGLMCVSAESTPNGLYCGDIYGNIVQMEVDSHTHFVNVTAHILGSKISCPHEPYHYNTTNTHLYLPEDPSDCLNVNLKKHGACPCPPEIVYQATKNQLLMEHTPIGTIVLKSC